MNGAQTSDTEDNPHREDDQSSEHSRSSEATGLRVREAIRRSGLKQRKIAAAIGIDETKLSKALSGRRRFTADELLGVATATGVTVRWLLGDESQVSAPPPNTATVPDSDEDANPKRSIAEAAWTLFGRHGFDAVRIADIAAASGVSAPSIHYYFANKSDLFDAALDYSVKLAFDRQIAWLDEIADPAQRLERLLKLQSPLGRTERGEWSIWLQTWARLSLEDSTLSNYPLSYERWSKTVQTTIEEGQRTGRFRSGDPRAMADELTSLLDGLGIKVLTGVMDTDTFAQRLRTYLDRSIRHPSPAPATPTTTASSTTPERPTETTSMPATNTDQSKESS
ncbi:TetR family transcriptional regulator C-terminal domain-containing protein [Brevibacterium linens]|uniref:Transcriptional regulator, TetR family n=1 Tax=Brevibacterium linens ATCC 9172 TaxID=1255617 RepID=A0A2H1IAA5_BRELN|nr:TetR family transcriptional regulator C-terminal domain-containing protein [Brevibacterium linens]AZU00664.1 helix-turn-helix domain-containing protein [Brevibacterium linens]KAB1949236.1 TetR family transcriptional regulator [Brevibacterium linens ATCC 9172]SMX72141.1 transcriptional regulator, TetR family [Brevibacterium linens ATCC 9172]